MREEKAMRLGEYLRVISNGIKEKLRRDIKRQNAINETTLALLDGVVSGVGDGYSKDLMGRGFKNTETGREGWVSGVPASLVNDMPQTGATEIM